MKELHAAHPDMGYRRIRDKLDMHMIIHVNDKRVLRICRALHIQFTIKFRRHGRTRSAASPRYVAKNSTPEPHFLLLRFFFVLLAILCATYITTQKNYCNIQPPDTA
ncbi:MAG: IS3 family transposase [Oscillospiraceae bacterium]|nr:IS3 family transposase [Oscillospiraceae bacterium]